MLQTDRHTNRTENGLIDPFRNGQSMNLDLNEATDDGVAVASAGPYANHLHLAAAR